MGYLGDSIKNLGFGLMRLPMKDDAIDIEQTRQMVDLFMEAGFTYFDTAWAYKGSEDAIRQALVERYPRESFQLATKCAAWIGCKTREDAIAQFEVSLKQTGAGYFDFYLLHNLGESRTKFFDDFGMWDWAAEQKAKGLIKHFGFSFHSTPDELDDLLTKHPEVEFVQLQINYADWTNPAIQSKGVYEVARKHGKSVVIMEPVKGGLLANPPEPVLKVLKEAEPDSSAASWAVRFAANLDGLVTVLSGMSSVEQMKDNLSYMKEFTGLTEKQTAVLDKAREELAKIPVVPCTTCNYCAKVCPMNVGVSGTFTALNLATLYGDLRTAKFQEAWQVGGHGKANAATCIKCGKCETVCPQHISVRDELDRAVEILEIKPMEQNTEPETLKLMPFLRSILEQDSMHIVVCDTKHTIIYMNAAAGRAYEKRGGMALLGSSLLDCHNEQSCKMIQKIVDWFSADSNNNTIHTYFNEQDMRDVYMVALRDDGGKLIGYYEKHECRRRDETPLYDFS